MDVYHIPGSHDSSIVHFSRNSNDISLTIKLEEKLTIIKLSGVDFFYLSKFMDNSIIQRAITFEDVENLNDKEIFDIVSVMLNEIFGEGSKKYLKSKKYLMLEFIDGGIWLINFNSYSLELGCQT